MTIVRPEGAERDGGFTLIELTISVVLMGVASMAIIGVLMSQSAAERSVTTFANNHEDIRQTIVALQRDLRSAEPLTEVAAPEALKFRVDLRVYTDVAAAAPTQIRWRVDSATGELLREELDQYDTVIGVSHRLAGVANVSKNIPLFTYYKADNSTFDLSAIGTTAGTVAHCTTRVAIDLYAAPNGGERPAQVQTDVQLRNRLPGAEECI